MPRTNQLCWAIGISVALSLCWFSVADAQQPPGQGGGGPGGGRGGRGGFGNPVNSDPLRLVRDPAVQEELSLTQKQKDDIEKLNQDVGQGRRDLFQSMRGNNGGGGRGGRGGGGGGGIPGGGGGFPGGGGFDPGAIQTAMTEIQKKSDAALGKLLNTKQKTRLNQIDLQEEGLMNLTRPDVQARLNLSPGQQEKIQVIMDQMRQGQRDLFTAQRGAFQLGFRGNNPGGGGPPQPGNNPGGRPQTGNGNNPGGRPQPGAGNRGGAPKQDNNANNNNNGNNNGNNNNGGGRFQMTDEQRAQFTKMREEGDKIRQKALQELNKVLSKKQGAAFQKMLGEPFDFSKMTNRRFGGPPGAGGPNGNNNGNAGATGNNRGPDQQQPKNASPRGSTRKTGRNSG